MLRGMLAEAAITAMKFLFVPLYAAWAIKLGVIDAGTNPLFAVPMVLLSIWGLWVIARTASTYVERVADSQPDALS